MNELSVNAGISERTDGCEDELMHDIAELLEDIRQGRMVIMMDDEDRENEGDLIMAASMVRPEDINFMARYGRGLICLPLTRERCRQLNLGLMVSDNMARFATNFTVSIEAAEGVTTGISAYDRAHTIRTAVKPDADAADLTQPGHIFPLMAQPGGVLTRAGHTEAAVDLALLAGLEPAAVLVEILNEDGTMARRKDLHRFAAEHQLKIGTIADLIRYRLHNERSVEPVHSQPVSNAYGDFQLITYRDSIHKCLHWALLKGEPDPEQAFLVRVHVQNMLGDVLGLHEPSFGLPLQVAMREIQQHGAGLVLVLANQENDEQRLAALQQRAPAAHEAGDNAAASELRTYGIGAQIIHDLGIRKMRVLSAPKRFLGLSGFGLEVVEYVDSTPQDHLS
ncbi:MAG: 3,4-dihydroxy-2-butanone-4-phosphate synthase [Wenzhouxiangellaceae bacterium]